METDTLIPVIELDDVVQSAPPPPPPLPSAPQLSEIDPLPSAPPPPQYKPPVPPPAAAPLQSQKVDPLPSAPPPPPPLPSAPPPSELNPSTGGPPPQQTPSPMPPPPPQFAQPEAPIYSPMPPRPPPVKKTVPPPPENQIDLDPAFLAVDWPPEVMNINVAWFRLFERVVRFVMGWVLMVCYVSNADSLVDHPHGSGAGASVAMAVFCWFWGTSAMKLVYQLTEKKFSGEIKEFRTISVDCTIALVLIIVTAVYWRFEVYQPKVGQYRTTWRCFCGTMVACSVLEMSGLVIKAVDMPTLSKIQLFTMGRAISMPMFCMFLNSYDRLPRARDGTSPNVGALIGFALFGSVLYFLETVRFVYRFGENTCYGNRKDYLVAEREVSRFFVITMFLGFLSYWVLVYQQDYSQLSKDCDIAGLPSLLRYKTSEYIPEQNYTCHVKCNNGVTNGLDECVADFREPCCNHITSIFTLGEWVTVRSQYIIVLILYAIPVAAADFITEAIFLSKPEWRDDTYSAIAQ